MDVQLSLINLVAEGTFIFQFFPAEASSRDRANWQPQETTVGVKPLFYANREPREIAFDELYLDSTETGESLTPQIKQLRALMDETEQGTPPPLLAAWGDRQERCVLEELDITEMKYGEQGFPVRIRISLRLLQIQPVAGVSTTRII